MIPTVVFIQAEFQILLGELNFIFISGKLGGFRFSKTLLNSLWVLSMSCFRENYQNSARMISIKSIAGKPANLSIPSAAMWAAWVARKSGVKIYRC